MTISILDCTLRDGGYINNWDFPVSQTLKIINSLNSSNIDIVELGYLSDRKGKANNSTLFDSVETIDSLVKEIDQNFNKVVMINLFDFDVSTLPQKSETQLDGIRLAFHKKDLRDAFEHAKIIIELGYELFFQPMVTKNYSDDDFIALINEVNRLNIHAFYIVDSFGSMFLKDFRNYMQLANKYLRDDISLGFHSHNNMQLAFSNAIDLYCAAFNRKLIIDSSVYGMGRGAGNLNTELIISYLNMQGIQKYKVLPLLELIDEVLAYYFKRNPWGFSPAQYLSASLGCHPDYASYLVNKKTTHMADIKEILGQVPISKKVSFDKQIVDDLYRQFLLKHNSTIKGCFDIPKNKQVLLIASGHSVVENMEAIKQKAESEDYFVIALNYKPQFDCDYYFFSNQQRFDEFKEQLPIERIVITSNIKCNNKTDFVVDLGTIAYIGDAFVTNVAILMINYLILQGVQKVVLAGLDGYQTGRDNYAYDETKIPDNLDLFIELNHVVESSLMELKLLIDIKLITPSFYADFLH